MNFQSITIITFILVSFYLSACDTKPKWEQYDGGIHVVLKAESKGNATIDQANTAKIAEMIDARLKELGIKNKIIRIHKDCEIVVQLPPCKNPDRVVNLISYPAILTFKLVEEEHSSEEIRKSVPKGNEVLTMKTWDRDTDELITKPIVVKQQPVLSGDFVKYVSVGEAESSDGGKDIYVTLEFNAEGAKTFEKITTENIGRRLAIAVDNTVYSVPFIREKISGGRASITGGFTADEAQSLAIVLRVGSFPVQVKVVERKTLEEKAWLGAM